MNIISTHGNKEKEEDKGEEVDGKVVQAPQCGYVPGTFLKKHEEGDHGFLSSADLNEMLVCTVGYVGGCLDACLCNLLSSQVPWVCVTYCTGGGGDIQIYKG